MNQIDLAFATPVFADIDADTQMVSAKTIEQLRKPENERPIAYDASPGK